MEKLNVLLVSTTKDIENKLNLVLSLIENKKVDFKIYLYTNKKLENLKNIEVVVLNENKNELINQGLKNLQENVAIINLDYSLKTIKNNLENILENFEDYDIINFKQKESKTKAFFSKILLTIYNFILSLFNIPYILNNSQDFQFLSTKVLSVMYNTYKSPNFMRNFNNFNGFETKNFEIESEKIKYKKNNKFLVLALFLLSLVIISLGIFIFVLISHSGSPKISKVILLELIGVVTATVLIFTSLTYNKYLNLI